jgi:hypothetical protein
MHAFLRKVVEGLRDASSSAIVQSAVAGTVLGTAWAIQQVYQKVEVPLTPLLRLALGKCVYGIRGGSTLVMNSQTHQYMVDLDRGAVYRVKTSTWSGFVVRKDNDKAAVAIPDTINMDGVGVSGMSPWFSIVEDSKSSEDKTLPSVVFYVRQGMIPALQRFISDATGGSDQPQVLVTDQSRVDMLETYIVEQSTHDPAKFVQCVEEGVGAQGSRAGLKNNTLYPFALPDGTRAVACQVNAPRSAASLGDEDGRNHKHLVLGICRTDTDTSFPPCDPRDTLRRLTEGIEAVRLAASASKKGRTLNVYTVGGYYKKWILSMNTTPARDTDSVVLDGNKKEFILEDMRTFLGDADRYAALGVAHRRGYLLYGPPGTGKTSFIRLLASHFGLSLCIINLLDVSDEELRNLMNTVPQNCLLVFEDLDRLFILDGEDRRLARNVKISLTGLLNALDGVGSSSKYVVVVTANNIDKLDPAVYRAGRCDVKLRLDNASPAQLRALLRRFFPAVDDATADAFLAAVADMELSPAAVQVYFMKCKTHGDVLANLAWLADIQTVTVESRHGREDVHGDGAGDAEAEGGFIGGSLGGSMGGFMMGPVGGSMGTGGGSLAPRLSAPKPATTTETLFEPAPQMEAILRAASCMPEFRHLFGKDGRDPPHAQTQAQMEPELGSVGMLDAYATTDIDHSETTTTTTFASDSGESGSESEGSGSGSIPNAGRLYASL